MDSIMRGETSPFDSHDWLHVQPAEHYSLAHGSTVRAKVRAMQLLTQIPRLIQLVRASDSAISRVKALELAEDLYHQDLKEWEERIRKRGLNIFPNTLPDQGPSLIPQLLSFDSFETFLISCDYWTGRVVLLGLMQRLSDVPEQQRPSPRWPDITTLRTEDEQAALNLAMCVPYTMELEPKPLGALQILAPLQMSFGAWHRCAKRSTNGMRDRAQDMKDWVYGKAIEITRLWKGREGPKMDLEVLTEIFMGEPLPQGTLRKWKEPDQHWKP